MNKYIIAIVICSVSFAFAEEMPSDSDIRVSPVSISNKCEQMKLQSNSANKPIWENLKQMTSKERMKSKIEFELDNNTPPQALKTAGWIKSGWNNRQYEKALGLFIILEKLIDINEITIRKGELDIIYISTSSPHLKTSNLDNARHKSNGFTYLPGDVNMYNGLWPPSVIGSDVTYLVNYFRGRSTSQPCYLDGFWASADINGDCNIIGSDVTRLVSYLKGNGIIQYCLDYPPLNLSVPLSAPTCWPNCELQDDISDDAIPTKVGF